MSSHPSKPEKPRAPRSDEPNEPASIDQTSSLTPAEATIRDLRQAVKALPEAPKKPSKFERDLSDIVRPFQKELSDEIYRSARELRAAISQTNDPEQKLNLFTNGLDEFSQNLASIEERLFDALRPIGKLSSRVTGDDPIDSVDYWVERFWEFRAPDLRGWALLTCGGAEDEDPKEWPAPPWLLRAVLDEGANREAALDWVKAQIDSVLLKAQDKARGAARISLTFEAEPAHSGIPTTAEADGKGSKPIIPHTRRKTKYKRQPRPEVDRRRAIQRRNPDHRVLGLCTLFDDERIPLPPGWAVGTWVKAYNHGYSRRVRVIVSHDRKAIGLPPRRDMEEG